MIFVNWMDNLPLYMKIIFALPILDIVWAIYRLVKGAVTGQLDVIFGGLIWVILGWAILWIVDLICICIKRKPIVFAE